MLKRERKIILIYKSFGFVHTFHINDTIHIWNLVWNKSSNIYWWLIVSQYKIFQQKIYIVPKYTVDDREKLKEDIKHRESADTSIHNVLGKPNCYYDFQPVGNDKCNTTSRTIIIFAIILQQTTPHTHVTAYDGMMVCEYLCFISPVRVQTTF